MSRRHHRKRAPDGKGATARWSSEEAERETCGPDVQKRRSRPTSRGEVAPHTEPGFQAAEVNGAGSMEDSCSYPGRPPRLSVFEMLSKPGRRPVTVGEGAEESAEVVVLAVEARGRGKPTVGTREAFETRKDRTSRNRETSVSSRGRR